MLHYFANWLSTCVKKEEKSCISLFIFDSYQIIVGNWLNWAYRYKAMALLFTRRTSKNLLNKHS